MDAASRSWYFSTVVPRLLPAVRRVDFHRTKYGRELLFDAALLSQLPGFDFSDRPQVLTFYDVSLVTRGGGELELDGVSHALRRGRAFFTRPGVVRRFRTAGVDGACFFFTSEFVGQVFADTRFLQRFSCLRADGARAFLDLDAPQRRAFRALFARMQAEMAALRSDASEVLRALLYEMLVLLERWYVERHGRAAAVAASRPVERFLALAERDFARQRRLADYAAELGLSPGHLRTLCRRHLGMTAGAWLRSRLALEARRLLVYGGQGAAQAGYALGFEDPSYFARFVRRETGSSPSRLARRRVETGGPDGRAAGMAAATGPRRGPRRA